MNLWKQLLLGAYYHGTRPWRSRRMARLAAEGRAPAIVLFYHRIADGPSLDGATSNDNFVRQIDWLRKHFDMVSLAETQRRIASGENHRPSISITFDDGYADNCFRALPLLAREKIPCTYFVSIDMVRGGKAFPHDIARGRPLRPNTIDELREMVAAGIEIGAHTRSHADLGRLSEPDAIYDELVGSKHDLEEMTGAPIRYFAFPYGQHWNLNPLAFEIAREEGFDGVCSAYGGFNFPGDDPFHLQRIHVDDGLLRMQNWVTLDPRKLRLTKRYEYACGRQTVGGLS